MVVDQAGDALTARTDSALLLVKPQIVDGRLTLTAPGMEPLTVAAPTSPLLDVAVHGNRVAAAWAGQSADEWFSALLGAPTRLVHLDDPTRRAPHPDYSSSDDRVSLADGYPLLLVNEASLTALSDLVAAGPDPDSAPLSMLRFRPNLVVTGAAAWAEDGWRRIRIGEATFRAVKGCSRCVLTTIDPETLDRGREPILTLARHRRWDGKTWFGVNLIPDLPDATVQLGDEVEILDEKPDPDGPLR